MFYDFTENLTFSIGFVFKIEEKVVIREFVNLDHVDYGIEGNFWQNVKTRLHIITILAIWDILENLAQL